jgi:transposase
MSRAYKLEISDVDKVYLEKILRTRTTQAQVAQRARILLLKNEGLYINAIADKVGVNRNSVMLCLEKYRNGGVENALTDAPGRGRNAEITDEEKAWIINIACQRPYELGYSAETWTLTTLTTHINYHAEASSHIRLSTVSRSTVQKVLEQADIKPHRIRYYCEKRDPNFDEKMHEILVVYKQIEMQFDEDGKLLPFEGIRVNTISYDEKPGIQALANTSPDRMPISVNGYRQRDYEYKRLGTVSLLAGIDLLTGEAIPLVRESHKSSDFIEFLKLLDSKYPKKERIRLILDNHSSHISKETQAFLETKPNRFEFVFTPTHGSWLNMIEGFFSKLTRQSLRKIRVSTKEELVERIYKYFEEINEMPVVFRWTYKMDEIKLESTGDSLKSS